MTGTSRRGRRRDLQPGRAAVRVLGLAASERRPDAVIVVDNASTDDTQAGARRCQGAHRDLSARGGPAGGEHRGRGGFHLGVGRRTSGASTGSG